MRVPLRRSSICSVILVRSSASNALLALKCSMLVWSRPVRYIDSGFSPFIVIPVATARADRRTCLRKDALASPAARAVGVQFNRSAGYPKQIRKDRIRYSSAILLRIRLWAMSKISPHGYCSFWGYIHCRPRLVNCAGAAHGRG